MASRKLRNLASRRLVAPNLLRGLRRRRRGVSPIIATILLVAITVVLAAVLYVLISGLTHSGASTPYSINFGTPTWSGGTPDYGTIRIASATTGLTTALFGLTVATSTGGPVAVGSGPAGCKAGVAYATATCTAATGNWYAVIYYLGNGTIANVFSANAWTGATVSVGQTQALVVIGPSSLQGSGDILAAVGTTSSSVSGSSGSF